MHIPTLQKTIRQSPFNSRVLYLWYAFSVTNEEYKTREYKILYVSFTREKNSPPSEGEGGGERDRTYSMTYKREWRLHVRRFETVTPNSRGTRRRTSSFNEQRQKKESDELPSRHYLGLLQNMVVHNALSGAFLSRRIAVWRRSAGSIRLSLVHTFHSFSLPTSHASPVSVMM